MTIPGRLAGTAALVLMVCLSGSLPAARQPTPVTAWLDQYLRGQFDAVLNAVREDDDYNRIVEELKKDGPAWMAAGGDAQRERRELAAATFALEAARLDAWRDWKYRQLTPYYLWWYDEKDRLHRPEILTWKAAPLLLEWGCVVMRRAAGPRPIERWWQLAALSVAQRAEDFEFLRSDTIEDLYNNDARVDHLFHVRQRFMDEPRLMLAEAMLPELHRRPTPKGLYTFEQLQDHPAVGAEATLRLGYVRARARDDGGAIELFNRVETKTRDPWVIYLARYFKGRAFEHQQKPADAERAYRGALAAVPGATSATTELAALLFRNNRRADATTVVEAMFAIQPRPADPWRGYADADDRFWPTLIAGLRREIGR
jgi:hypothetical protein